MFLASDMRFRDQWVFDTGKRLVGSSAAGYGPLGTWTLAQAVAASSCVPGAFSVVKAKQEPSSLTGGSYKERDRDELVREIDLSDGGMFDNLGVEPVWQDHETVLVSDAAPSFKPEPEIGWLWSALRQGVILLEQATEVRKRWLVSNSPGSSRARTGASRRSPGATAWRRSTPPTPRISSATTSLRSASTWTSSRRARSPSSRTTAT